MKAAYKLSAALIVGMLLSMLSWSASAEAWIRLAGPAQTHYEAPASYQFHLDSGVIGTGPKAEYLESVQLFRNEVVVSMLPVGTFTEYGISPGTYHYVMRAVAVRHVNGDEFRRNITSPTVTVTVAAPPAPVDGATPGPNHLPLRADRGTAFSGPITFHNTGTTVWRAADGHRLGQAANFSSARFGIGDIPVPHDVPPGASATFHVAGVAPNENGEYALQWQMNRNGGHFGATGSVNLFTVTGKLNRGVLYEQSVPTTMEAGRSYPVTLKFVNTGNTTWSASKGYALGSWQLSDNHLWGVARVPPHQDVLPQLPGIFSFNVTAPAVPGIHRFQWRMLEEHVEWFGGESPEVLVTVTGPPSRIVGHIDSVSQAGRIDGWACSTGIAAPIDVHVYTGGPHGGGGTLLTTGVAANANEPSITEACQAGGGHRFSIQLTDEQRRERAGQSVHIHGISPVGQPNSVIANSGAFLLPPVPTGQLWANPAYCQIGLGEGSCSVELRWSATSEQAEVRSPGGMAIGTGRTGSARLTLAAGSFEYLLAVGADTLARATVSARGPPTIGVPTHPAPTVQRSYVYDQYMRLCKVVEPETGSTVFDYDAAGNLVWTAHGVPLPDRASCDRSAPEIAGRRIVRTFDGMNRLRTVSHPDGQGDQTLQYTAEGQLASATVHDQGRAAVSTARTYNSLGSITSESMSIGAGATRSVRFDYDRMGNHVQTVYPDGYVVRQILNGMGEPIGLSSPQSGLLASGVTYAPTGAISSLTFGNGIVRNVGYNARQRISHLQDGALVALGYEYDVSGNPTVITDGVRGSAGRIALGYDPLYRLTSATSAAYGASGQYSFSYDTLDNLASLRLPGKREQTYLYDGLNRLELLRDESSSSVMAFGYDAGGNMTLRNGEPHVFDIAGRLRAAGSISEYLYNGTGHRVAASGESTSTWQYLAGGELITSSKGDESSNYIYLGSRLIAIRTTSPAGEKLTYLHHDAQGNLAASSNAQGQLLSQHVWSPYGEVDVPPSSEIPGYSGHLGDGSSGLIYMGQRYYDPLVGRFISPDPFASSTSSASNFNRYRYAGNNPFRYSDPTGACEQVTGSHVCGTAFAGDRLTATQYAAPSGQIPVHNPNAPAAAPRADPTGLDAVMAYFAERNFFTGQGSITDLDSMVESIGIPFMESPPGRGIGAGAKLASFMFVARAGSASAKGYGDLSRAGEFGIDTYSVLKKKVGTGSGLHVHHLVERRFSGVLRAKHQDMASVVVTPAEHQKFTNLWHGQIPRGVNYDKISPEQVMNAARNVYADHPVILKALGL